jgi:hypothetical protein
MAVSVAGNLSRKADDHCCAMCGKAIESVLRVYRRYDAPAGVEGSTADCADGKRKMNQRDQNVT